MNMTLLKHGGVSIPLLSLVFLIPTGSEGAEFRSDNPLNPPPPIFWCPSRTPDQQIAATPQPGCEPLANEDEIKARRAERAEKGKPREEKPIIKVHEIQTEASNFVNRYGQFLKCCATDVTSLETIDDFIDEADHILKSVQQKAIFNSAGEAFRSGVVASDFSIDGSGSAVPGGSGVPGGISGQNPKLGTFARQWTISAIVRAVVQARDDLKSLEKRLKALAEAKQGVNELGFEASARERRRIEEEEQAIQKEFRVKRPPESARTGMEIQDTSIPTRIGGDIEDTTLRNTFGADVGDTVSPYSDIKGSLRLKNATEVQDTSLPTRAGPLIQDSDTPNAIGFEIGTEKGPTGPTTNPVRVGPGIGDSSLNERR